MKIKAKFTVFQLFTIVIAGIFVIASYFALKNQNRLFREFIYKQNTISVNSILDLQKKAMIRTVEDYTVWDGMYSFTRTRDKGWAKSNIDSLITDFGYDHVWILDTMGAEIYYIHNPERKGIDSIIYPFPDIRQKLHEKTEHYFFILYNGEIFEMAVSKISPTGDYERIKSSGFLVIARVWDRKYMETLKGLTLHEVLIPSAVNIGTSGAAEKADNITVVRVLHDFFGRELLKAYLSRHMEDMDSVMNMSYYLTATIIIVSLVLFVMFFVFIGRWITRPLNVISNALNTENAALLDYLDKNRDEFYDIADLIRTSLDNKKRINELLNIAKADLSMAVNVQRSFLPQETPQSNDWDAAFYMQPMSEVSGDFYDFYILNEKFSGLGIFDVSGHGIASGLVTMIAKSLFFRSFREHSETGISDIFRSVSKELYSAIGSSNYFLTGIILRFDGDRVEYCNAMHTPLLKKRGNTISSIDKQYGNDIHGFFIGFDDNHYSYDEISINLKQGDCLLLYTDCLLEGSSITGERYGIERIEHALSTAPAGTAQEVLDFILEDYFSFVAESSDLSDDLTVIALKKK